VRRRSHHQPTNKFSPEVHERAVRMVGEHRAVIGPQPACRVPQLAISHALFLPLRDLGHQRASTSDIYSLFDPANLGLALAVTEQIIDEIENLSPGAFTGTTPDPRSGFSKGER